MESGWARGIKQARRGCVMRKTTFWWETLHPGIHVDGNFTHCTRMVWRGFNALKSLDHNSIIIKKKTWNVLHKQVWSTEAPPHNLQDFRDPLLTSCWRIQAYTLWSTCLVESELLWKYWAGGFNHKADWYTLYGQRYDHHTNMQFFSKPMKPYNFPSLD